VPGDTATSIQIPTLKVVTRPLADVGVLTEWVSPTNPLVFMRRGVGLVGRGRGITHAFVGPQRISDASKWWSDVSARADIDDSVGVWGSGLVAFGAMAFSDQSQAPSVLVIPRTVIGKSDDVAWRTDITVVDTPQPDHGQSTVNRSLPQPLAPVKWQPGLFTEEDFIQAVNTVIGYVDKGHANKVVLARDMIAKSGQADWRQAIQRLSDRYPDTHTFAIDGLVGASPETLVSLRNGSLHTRVLAGSRERGGNDVDDQQKADELFRSSKDLDEHRFAVHSVVEALKTLTPHVVADDLPFTLKLANLWHLATDIAATLPPTATGLDAVAALHPTAAVAGSPTDKALDIINALEPFDRGRYAGPVGWVDSQGDGEWAIALRCAQWSPDGTLSAYAGAGIVPGSHPESELLETRLKFQPIIEAFS
jgi:menaquinone-specific isochorismate synthase